MRMDTRMVMTGSVTADSGVVLTPQMVKAAVARSRRLIAPLWPLQKFVAVNPFLGLTDQRFETAVSLMAQRAGASMTAPRSLFAEAIRSGRITETDLEAALAAGSALPGAPADTAALAALAFRDAPDPVKALVPTVAEIAHQVTGEDWASFVTEAISRWAAAYFDQGQAYWKSPWRHLPAFAAWQQEAAVDRTPEVAGIRGFRQMVLSLPATAAEAQVLLLRQLNVPVDGLDAYLHRLLLTVGGWAGYARYLLWEAELRGEGDTTVDDLLTIRLAWEVALLRTFADEGLSAAWAVACARFVDEQGGGGETAVFTGDLLLQAAYEHGFQRQMAATLAAAKPETTPSRPRVQAAFCIDVRSEPFRRALEAVDDGVETLGFAGFFGFPIEYVRLGEEQGGAQCPALIAPQFVVREAVSGLPAAEAATVRAKRGLRQRAMKVWRSFKFGAVSCFGFVGPVGLAYVPKLITDSLRLSRPVTLAAASGLNRGEYARLAPSLQVAEWNGRTTGMSLAQQLDVAEGMLRAMSLTDNFARLVMLVGHGASTVNNPFATGLDCGACGGHTGEANVRVAAMVLNDAVVRAGLRERGIIIPADTLFLAGQHDTTTDRVMIFDRTQIPGGFAADVARIEASLAAAGGLVRAERAPRLGVTPAADVDAAVLDRSRDWSQVRPEWGLAGCAAFVVAPRQRTAGLNLDGRSFLHSYDWKADKGFGVLELIMTAPMVVTSWINLQYYGSAVDNRVFGSGNKVLHNVVGALGVLEGNGGDLRVGLPWQSVHDGRRLVHEPVRLSVYIEAPLAAMTNIIERHEPVRQLLDNGWVYLFALDDAGRVSHRYSGGLNWTAVSEAVEC